MLSLMIPPSAVSKTGSAVVPRVFSSSHPGRGRVMSTTWKATRSSRPFRDSRISSRWEKGQTGMWYTVGVSRTPTSAGRRKVSLDMLPPSLGSVRRIAAAAENAEGGGAGFAAPPPSRALGLLVLRALDLFADDVADTVCGEEPLPAGLGGDPQGPVLLQAVGDLREGALRLFLALVDAVAHPGQGVAEVGARGGAWGLVAAGLGPLLFLVLLRVLARVHQPDDHAVRHSYSSRSSFSIRTHVYPQRQTLCMGERAGLGPRSATASRSTRRGGRPRHGCGPRASWSPGRGSCAPCLRRRGACGGRP